MALREIIFNNFWLKLASLVLAIMIWAAIAIPTDSRLGRDIANIQTLKLNRHPITVMKAADDIRAFKVLPAEVDITVSGRPEALQTLSEKDVEVFINLTDAYDTEGLVKKVLVRAPASVTVTKVEPASVRIERIRSE